MVLPKLKGDSCNAKFNAEGERFVLNFPQDLQTLEQFPSRAETYYSV